MAQLFDEGECLPPGIDPELWCDFVQGRKEMKKPITGVGKRRALQKLVRLQNEGYDANDILERSIIAGYRGLFPTDKPQRPDPVAELFDGGYRLQLSPQRPEPQRDSGVGGAQPELSERIQEKH